MMTKAERIFHKTRFECKQLFKNYGFNYNPNGNPVSFDGLIYDENDIIYVRTINAIQKIIDREKKNTQFDLRLNIIDKSEYDNDIYILDMIQVALDRQKEVVVK